MREDPGVEVAASAVMMVDIRRSLRQSKQQIKRLKEMHRVEKKRLSWSTERLLSHKRA